MAVSSYVAAAAPIAAGPMTLAVFYAIGSAFESVSLSAAPDQIRSTKEARFRVLAHGARLRERNHLAAIRVHLP
jgi:hypothetical protein